MMFEAVVDTLTASFQLCSNFLWQALSGCFYVALFIGSINFLASTVQSSFQYGDTGDIMRTVERLFKKYSDKRRTLQHAVSGQLTPAHIDRIASRKWKEVLAWIVFHPEELSWVDKRKQTALHHACLFRAPAQVIEMILFQAPQTAAMANIDEELPLHWAVRLSAPHEVIKWLLTVNPASACDARDNDGNSALSLVWERHEEALMAHWWESGTEKIDTSNAWKRILFYLQCYSYYLEKKDSLLVDEEDDGVDDNVLFRHSGSFRALHIATRCPSCPTSLFTLILKVYRNQLQEEDEYGRLPLTLACSDPISNRSVGAVTKVHLLLAEQPSSASRPDQLSGRLPIFTALASKLIWEEGIDHLFTLAPKSLLLLDPHTKLPPFLLAAAAGTENQAHSAINSTACHVCVSEARSLSTIFSLLRADPAQLSPQQPHYENTP